MNPFMTTQLPIKYPLETESLRPIIPSPDHKGSPNRAKYTSPMLQAILHLPHFPIVPHNRHLPRFQNIHTYFSFPPSLFPTPFLKPGKKVDKESS